MTGASVVDRAPVVHRRPAGPLAWWLLRRRRGAIARQLPAAIETLAAEIGRGAGLLPALQTVAARSRPPLAQALAPLLAVEPGAAALDQALFALRDRIGGEDLAALVHMVLVAARYRSAPAAPFLRLARRLRLRQAADAKVGNLLQRARRRTRLTAATLLAATLIPILWRPAATLVLLRQPAGCLLVLIPVLLAGCGALLLERGVRIRGREA
jgi:Flp pilus assembly protein TadB